MCRLLAARFVRTEPRPCQLFLPSYYDIYLLILGTYLLILRHISPHTSIYMSSYYSSYILIILYISSHTVVYVSSYNCVFLHTTVYVSSYPLFNMSSYTTVYMCHHTTVLRPHTTVCVLILLYVCPPTTLYLSSYYCLCPHTTVCESS